MLPRLSIVIPIEHGDCRWRLLLQDLQTLPVDVELLLVGSEDAPADLDGPAGALAGRLRWLRTAQNRAVQQNLGAGTARGDWLCFLRADSRLDDAALRALTSLIRCPPALHYFDLGFFDGPRLLRLNALGTTLRSRLFDLPFGDQGLALPHAIFGQLGGFDETLACAEDHALVRAVHRAGVAVRALDAHLMISGRRYAEAGWLRTTLCSLKRSWRAARRLSKGENT